MREKSLVALALALFVLNPASAFAECHAQANGAANLVPQDLLKQVNQIAQDVPDISGGKLTDEQIRLLNERVVDLQNAAKAQFLKAQDAQRELNGSGDCGSGTTRAQCIQRQIDLDEARVEIMADGTKDKAETQSEINQLKVELNAPKTMTQASSDFASASGDLQEMLKTRDFSYKEHFGIIGKALLSSWKELLTPGPIIAVSAGMAGYGVARATPLNDAAKNEWKNAPAPAVGKLTDQIGYAYPVLAPFFIVAAATKNNETMKTFDALAVGTAISQAIVEPLKYGVREERPNGTDNLGFPSGHATETFMMATVLDHEYPGHHHIVGIASYGVAALVSFYRVREENHSPGEIFAGMGIGIGTGFAAAEAVDNEYNAAQGKKRAYWKDAVAGNFRIPRTNKVIHCVPVGLAGSCELSW